MFLGVLITLAILLAGNILGAVLVSVWAYWSRTPLKEIGVVHERHWLLVAIFAALAGTVLKVAVKAVLPVLGLEPVSPAYRYLTGNVAAVWQLMPSILIGAGIGEELIWRGFLFSRLRTWFKPARYADVGIVAVSSVLFALAHYADQGTAGVVQAFITGVCFGPVYMWRRSLLAPILMHTAFDLTAVALIYFNVMQ